MNETEASTEPTDQDETAAQEAEPRSTMAPEQLKTCLEGALLAAGQPLTLNHLNGLFDEEEQPGHGPIREALALLDAELADRAIELVEVAGGYRLQIRQNLMPTISRLWADKPPKYSRALLETLAIIAYRQPITRGEIEQIRGVSLSANILKTLQEREWVKTVGHRDIPGKPELLGTTRTFLDYFGLKGLDDLPTLAEIRDIDNLEPELDLNDPDHPEAANDEQETETEPAEEGSPEEVREQEDTEPEDRDRDVVDEQADRDGDEVDEGGAQPDDGRTDGRQEGEEQPEAEPDGQARAHGEDLEGPEEDEPPQG